MIGEGSGARGGTLDDIQPIDPQRLPLTNATAAGKIVQEAQVARSTVEKVGI